MWLEVQTNEKSIEICMEVLSLCQYCSNSMYYSFCTDELKGTYLHAGVDR